MEDCRHRIAHELWGVLDELFKAGAKAEELASLADDKNRYDISRYLLAHGLTDAARETLSRDHNPESAEFHLVQAQIALAARDFPPRRSPASAPWKSPP